MHIRDQELKEWFVVLSEQSAFSTDDKFLYALLKMYETALKKMEERKRKMTNEEYANARLVYHSDDEQGA